MSAKTLCSKIFLNTVRPRFTLQRRQYLFKVGGQAVIQAVMWRGAIAVGAFYSAKKWGGAIAPPAPPFTDASEVHDIY